MGFASAWLEKNALFPALINEIPDPQTGIIVVVPAFNESGTDTLLNSLYACTPPGCSVEVILLVNAPRNAGEAALQNNRLCITNSEKWKSNHNDRFFRLYAVDIGDHGLDEWGVGLARKAVMDEALRRFNTINNPEGAIVSLDADCTVERNYFTELNANLVLRESARACSVYFEHPLTGSAFGERIYRYIIQYELHLRYYLQGLQFAGFPFSFHTVGSAMACKASHYSRAGGMNRKQAGEDFYFIQKLVTLGGYFALNSTTVYPSPRESMRVPFGTGATIKKMMQDSSETLLTYDFNAFRELQVFFRDVEKLREFTSGEIEMFFKAMPEGIRSFIDPADFVKKIAEIRKNTAGTAAFRKRFFIWFNMLRIVKYLNHVHRGIYSKQSVASAAKEYLLSAGNDVGTSDPEELLRIYRWLERKDISYSFL